MSEATALDAATLNRIFLERYRELLEGMPEGEPTWVTSGGRAGGVYGAIAALSAEQASRPFPDGGATLAAHVNHLRWAIALVNGYYRGQEPGADWSESWAVSTVDQAQWQALQQELRKEGEQLLANAEAKHPWGDEFAATGCLSSLGHTAYHLGAIKQMVRAVSQA